MSVLADFVAKSEVAGRRIFRENTKREATADSDTLSRLAEVAACMIASSEAGHHLGDPGTYVPVEEPSTASIAVVLHSSGKSGMCH
jgi:hypothetical protein